MVRINNDISWCLWVRSFIKSNIEVRVRARMSNYIQDFPRMKLIVRARNCMLEKVYFSDKYNEDIQTSTLLNLFLWDRWHHNYTVLPSYLIQTYVCITCGKHKRYCYSLPEMQQQYKDITLVRQDIVKSIVNHPLLEHPTLLALSNRSLGKGSILSGPDII